MKLYSLILLFSLILNNLYSQSYVSGSTSIYIVKYEEPSDFDFDNISSSYTIAFRHNFTKKGIIAYSGLRYFNEKTNSNCVSFNKEKDIPISSYHVDDQNCEYNHFRKTKNLGLQLGLGYKTIRLNNFNLYLNLENNIILSERKQHVFETTEISPNVVDHPAYNKGLTSFMELYFGPLLNYTIEQFYLEIGYQYGMRDFKTDKILNRLKLSIGIEL